MLLWWIILLEHMISCISDMYVHVISTEALNKSMHDWCHLSPTVPSIQTEVPDMSAISTNVGHLSHVTYLHEWTPITCYSSPQSPSFQRRFSHMDSSCRAADNQLPGATPTISSLIQPPYQNFMFGRLAGAKLFGWRVTSSTSEEPRGQSSNYTL